MRLAGSDVVSSHANENGQARAAQGRHRDKNSSYAYNDSTLRGNGAKQSSCWPQTSLSAPKPPGNFNGAGILPPHTQSHAFRPPYKVSTPIYINSLITRLFCIYYPENLRLESNFFCMTLSYLVFPLSVKGLIKLLL